MTRKTVRVLTTTPELIAQIEPETFKLMKRFLKEKNTRSSDLTIKGYESDLEIFGCWNLNFNGNKPFVNIRKIEFSEFFAYCVETLGWGSARFAREKSTLSSFSNYIEKFFDDEYKNFRNNINKAVESMPKNPVREKTILTQEQIDKLFNHFETNKNYQICCWLALAISSGSRFSELLRFTTDIIDINHTAFDGIFLETLKPIKTKGRTKSGKMLVKYIIKDTFLKYYELWLPEREKIMKENNKNHNSIFIKSNGDPAEESTARTWVEKIEEVSECPTYPHCFRHWYTTYLSKIGLPYELIKTLVGWDSTLMCQIYDDVQSKDKEWKELNNLKEALKNNAPEGE